MHNVRYSPTSHLNKRTGEKAQTWLQMKTVILDLYFRMSPFPQVGSKGTSGLEYPLGFGYSPQNGLGHLEIWTLALCRVLHTHLKIGKGIIGYLWSYGYSPESGYGHSWSLGQQRPEDSCCPITRGVNVKFIRDQRHFYVINAHLKRRHNFVTT